MPVALSSEKPLGSACRTARPLSQACRRRRFQHALNVGPGHGPAADTDLGAVELRGETPAGDIDDNTFDLHAGHAFGRVHRHPDRAISLLHVDDGAAFDAPRALMANAEHRCRMRMAAGADGVRR